MLGSGVSVDRPDLAQLKVSGTQEERVERMLVEIDAHLKSLSLAPRLVIVEEWAPEYHHWRYHRKPGWGDSGGDWLSTIIDGISRGW